MKHLLQIIGTIKHKGSSARQRLLSSGLRPWRCTFFFEHADFVFKMYFLFWHSISSISHKLSDFVQQRTRTEHEHLTYNAHSLMVHRMTLREQVMQPEPQKIRKIIVRSEYGPHRLMMQEYKAFIPFVHFFISLSPSFFNHLHLPLSQYHTPSPSHSKSITGRFFGFFFFMYSTQFKKQLKRARAQQPIFYF